VRSLKRKIISSAFIFLLSAGGYYYFWGQYLYTMTAYCDCPICVNVDAYRDGRFASGRAVYWGGIAADPSIPFGTQIELVPIWPGDFWSIFRVLKNRKKFTVEDRGGKIKGKHIDLFIPHSHGGHQMALEWGVRKMRVSINGELAK